MLNTHLQSLWLNDKEQQIYLCIYQHGPCRVSHIAKITQIERSHIYKIIEKLLQQGWINETGKDAIKQFTANSIDHINTHLQLNQQQIQGKINLLPLLSLELQSLQKRQLTHLPSIKTYEWNYGIEQLFNELQLILKETNLKLVRAFCNNTVTTQALSTKILSHHARGFLEYCHTHHIQLDARIGTGVMLMEQEYHSNDRREFWELPTTPYGQAIIVIGDYLALILFHDIPNGIIMQSPGVSQMMHVLLDRKG
jgi:hypothetical protein